MSVISVSRKGQRNEACISKKKYMYAKCSKSDQENWFPNWLGILRILYDGLGNS